MKSSPTSRDKSVCEATPQAGDEQDDSLQASSSSSVLKTALVSALTSAIVCGSVLGAYHWMQKKTQIGVVDVASILETSELMFTDMLTKPDVSDRDRVAAYDLVRQTGPKVESAIAQIQSACNCVVLAKAAVVAGNATDYTAQAKRVLGLDGVDAQMIKARLKGSMASKAGASASAPRVAPR